MKFELDPHQKNLIFQTIGNLLMLGSILVLLFIYYPLIFIFVDPPELPPTPQKGEFIVIDKIRAFAPIVENVNPWNEKEYRKKLFNGVAQAHGTAHVGEKGTIYLFSHSADAPWRITKYNTAFYKLHFLRKGDIVKLIKNGKEYKYKVREKKIVWPNDTKYLKENFNKNQLILQTCTPIGTALQRLLVFADPI